jgi:hypothetical protein
MEYCPFVIIGGGVSVSDCAQIALPVRVVTLPARMTIKKKGWSVPIRVALDTVVGILYYLRIRILRTEEP